MLARDHKLLPFQLYCETLSRKRVHLRIPVSYHQKTIRGDVMSLDIEKPEPSRRMCVECVRRGSRKKVTRMAKLLASSDKGA